MSFDIRYKNALVCIAKNEDRHLGEWVRYHVNLGFSDIFVYQNDWRWTPTMNLSTKMYNIHLIEWDGEAKQLPAYNHFIDNFGKDFSWAAFFDCDEFLSIDIDKWRYMRPLLKVLDDLDTKHSPLSVGINWRFFGGKSAYALNKLGPYGYFRSEDDLRNRLVLSYLNCEAELDRHVKVMINMKKAKNLLHFVNPHCVDLALCRKNVTMSVAGDRFIYGPWNPDASVNGIQLNHYYQKTKEEFAEKIARGKADTPKAHPMYNYKESDFHLHDSYPNEDENAFRFWSNWQRNHDKLERSFKFSLMP